MGIAPALLGRFILETLHGPDPFRLQLRYFTQLGHGAEPAGFNILDKGAFAFATRNGPSRQIGGEFGHAYADEMVLKSAFFKPKTGGGEV